MPKTKEVQLHTSNSNATQFLCLIVARYAKYDLSEIHLYSLCPQNIIIAIMLIYLNHVLYFINRSTHFLKVIS